jgi:hypothetical protein
VIRRHHRRGRFRDDDMFQSFTENLLHSIPKSYGHKKAQKTQKTF